MDGIIEYPLLKPDELASAAWAAMQRQEPAEALGLWQALRELSPERPDGHIWPIQILWQSGRFEEAEILAATALTRLPDDSELAVQQAWIATAQQRWPEAAARWAKVRSRVPERLEGYVWGARALWQSGQTDDAEAVVSDGLRRRPDDIQILAESAWTATARCDWAEALRRWTRVREAAPERTDAPPRVVQALRMLGRIGESEALAATRLAQHPDDTELLIEHVLNATAREDWPGAAARLDTARSAAADPARVAAALGALDAQIRALAADAAPARAGDEPEISPSALMLKFESIGERCDFGAVQRHFGVEPLGLLRFAWSRLDSLVAALEDRFDAVGTVDDTSFENYGDETILRMRKYDLIFHTFVSHVAQLSEEKREAFYQQQRRRLLFLKDKLIADLEEPQKICVYATADYAADGDVARLFAALRAYGPNSLLYVRPERPGRAAGTVEILETGLYAGYFPGLANFVAGDQPPLDLWRRLCQRTYRLALDGASGNGFLKSLL